MLFLTIFIEIYNIFVFLKILQKMRMAGAIGVTFAWLFISKTAGRRDLRGPAALFSTKRANGDELPGLSRSLTSGAALFSWEESSHLKKKPKNVFFRHFK